MGRMYRQLGLDFKEHVITVPWDYDNPGATFELYAREIIPPGGEDYPVIVYNQGGPGFPAPRPVTKSGVIAAGLDRFRWILMDQRGTGRSNRLDADTDLPPLHLLRQDQIVRDAERLREHLGLDSWSLFGQSFGGFCITAYLSQFPESIDYAFLTGGLPSLEKSVDDVYRSTFTKLRTRHERFYQQFPWAKQRVEEILHYLDNSDEHLPTGERLSSLRFRTIGIELGRGTGFNSLAYLLEDPFHTVGGEKRLRSDFLGDVGQRVSFQNGPLYAVMHESIYGGIGKLGPTNWAAHRIREEFPEFAEEGTYLTGEHIFPWQFDEDPALRPLKDAAEELAQHDWQSSPYDVDNLGKARAKAAAAVYLDDIFVPFEESMATAQAYRDLRPMVTNRYQHNGIAEDGEKIFKELFRLAEDH